MSRRLLSACLGAAVLVSGSVRAGEPGENPPLSGGAIVTQRTDEPSSGHPGWIWTIERPYPPVFPSVYNSLPASLPTPTLYQLRPTARRTLAGSLLFGVNPVLALMPTAKALDAPGDHPQQVAGEDIFSEVAQCKVYKVPHFVSGPGESTYVWEETDWLKWFVSRWTNGHSGSSPEPNDYVVANLMQGDAPAEEYDAPLVPTLEMLPMPQEDGEAPDGITCPWLRQQAVDRHACQFADPQIGRSVLENFERLEQADQLLGMAKELARAGCIGEALEYCAFAQDLCPGSPCAARAAEVMCELYVRLCEPATKPEPGIEQQVKGLMKACRLLMNEGLHEQAAELARQAFALDPERVAADPLIYKMHLLAVTPASHSAGAEEASEPPSCPYCPPAGKPIREIVPSKKKPKSEPATSVPSGSEEASEEAGPSSLGELVEAMMGGPGRAQFGFGLNGDGSLRLCGECTYFGTIYHVLFSRGALAIWKTPDAAAVQP